jgi:trans-2,3-dihydro-3-hydroxyanthranilate isomerase
VRRFRYVVCDVFTDTPLAGNQLAVFTDARDLDELTMQALAKEMNFSESVFVLPPTVDDAEVRIRIFTPVRELPFAGHPVLGAAFVLGGPLQRTVLRLQTDAGVVPVELQRDGPRIVFGSMEQPIVAAEPVANADAIVAALGVDGSLLPVERYALGPGHAYVALSSPEEVAALQPDFDALAAATGDGERVKTRMFAPAHGVREDPATGSAAGPLALHLARHGWLGWGDQVEIRQGAEVGRPSTLYARAAGSADAVERVIVGGSAVAVARGEFAF